MALFDPEELDPARKIMYDQVVDALGDESAVQAQIEDVIEDQIVGMYDADPDDLRARFIAAGRLEENDE